MEQLYGPAIMFGITVVVATLFAIPAVAFTPKSKILKFYWTGFWMFLALITGFAGGANTLMLLGVNDVTAYRPIVNIVITAYVLFVTIAWFHICGKAAFSVFGNLYRRITG